MKSIQLATKVKMTTLTGCRPTALPTSLFRHTWGEKVKSNEDVDRFEDGHDGGKYTVRHHLGWF